MIIGYDSWNDTVFESVTASIWSPNYIEVKNSIVDHLRLDESSSVPINTSTKSSWVSSTRLNALFSGNLEGGNIVGSGINVTSLNIKRRKSSDLVFTLIDNIPFENNSSMEFIDYTCPIGNYIYSVNPVLSNGLEGIGSTIMIDSDFVGYFLIDKDTNNVQEFDKFIDSEPTINTQLNQGRVALELFGKYPSIFYDETNYHTFSLSTVLIGEQFENSGIKYEDFLNNFVFNHKSFLVKSSMGKVYVCDVSAPQLSNPLNAWVGRNYCVLSIQLTEVMDYEDYINGDR